MDDFLKVKRKRVRKYPSQFEVEDIGGGCRCNGIYYPYRGKKSNECVAKKDVRYFIKYINLYACKTGINATPGVLYYTWYQDKISCYVQVMTPIHTLATDYSSISVSYFMGILCDEDTAIVITPDGIDDGGAVIIVAEIDTRPGTEQPKVIEDDN